MAKNGAVIATVLVVTLIVIVTAVIILLVVTSGNNQENDVFNVGQINVTGGCSASNPLMLANKSVRVPLKTASVPLKMTSVPFQKSNTQPMKTEKSVVSIPQFTPSGESSILAEVGKNSEYVGLMNMTEESKEKKWDPEKNFPSRVKPVRPENSLGAKFGPDETEMQMYLPTPEEIFEANGHVSGPKYIRRGPTYKRGNDMRPIMVPIDYKDYDSVRRPNRPRIDEKWFSEAIEMEKKFYGNNIPKGIVSP